MLNCGIGRGFFDRYNVTPVDFDERKGIQNKTAS